MGFIRKLAFIKKMNLKEIVKNSYLHIIKGSLNRIILFEFDSILNHLIRLHIEVKTDESSTENADETLIITDKFFIYRNLWKAVLETLYSNHLPNINYSFDWKIEVTPYTIMLCELSKDIIKSEKEIEHLKTLTKFTDEDIESNFEDISDKIGLKKIEVYDYLKNILPQDLFPTKRKEQLLLLFRLMNFPPLEELALFFSRYNSSLKEELSQLSVAFTGIEESKIPDFGMSEPLHYSTFHFGHKLFEKHKINGFLEKTELQEYKQDFETIIQNSNKNISEFKDEIICPCCGKKQTISLPKEILQYKLLLKQRQLSKRIGLSFITEFTKEFKSNLSEKYYNFLPNLNKVDNPKCIILVEGESEEISIPLLSFRKRFILSQKDIQVYNSKSKQKLKEDFFNFKDKYPNRKIICLLDSDAIKERDDILRVIKDNKDKYRLIFIEKGTFEDIFDIQFSIKIVNDLYPDGDDIELSDFDQNKDFLSNIKKIMHFKKKAQFDKVLFAKTISLKIDVEIIPKQIIEILETAEDFTREGGFIKK